MSLSICVLDKLKAITSSQTLMHINICVHTHVCTHTKQMLELMPHTWRVNDSWNRFSAIWKQINGCNLVLVGLLNGKWLLTPETQQRVMPPSRSADSAHTSPFRRQETNMKPHVGEDVCRKSGGTGKGGWEEKRCRGDRKARFGKIKGDWLGDWPIGWGGWSNLPVFMEDAAIKETCDINLTQWCCLWIYSSSMVVVIQSSRKVHK